MSPVDVVFTRLGGAGDRVATGESTFLVECAEAAVILREATPSSLVVVDELGRGTSTFDGYSVAFAAFKKLALGVGCRTMFATHFHGLAREFRASPDVQLAHMAATVAVEDDDELFEDAGDDDDDAGGGDDDARGGGGGSAIASAAAPAPPPITFLYKLRPGACPKSYGVRVAALAGVPKEVLKLARVAAADSERRLSRAFGGDGAALTEGEKSGAFLTIFFSPISRFQHLIASPFN